MQRNSSQLQPSARRGVILLVAMVCLLLLSVVTGVLLSTCLSQRAQLRKNEQQAQAVCLAESGLNRAVQKLRADSNYKGETWKVSAKELSGPHDAEVVISIDKTEGKPGQPKQPAEPAGYRITVIARYPLSAPDAIQYTRRFTLPEADLKE